MGRGPSKRYVRRGGSDSDGIVSVFDGHYGRHYGSDGRGRSDSELSNDIFAEHLVHVYTVANCNVYICNM